MSALELTPEAIELASVTHPRAKPLDLDSQREASAVAKRHGLTYAQLMGPSRYSHIVRARAELYRVLRAAPYRWSYPAIGAFVGRDHTTVIDCIRRHP